MRTSAGTSAGLQLRYPDTSIPLVLSRNWACRRSRLRRSLGSELRHLPTHLPTLPPYAISLRGPYKILISRMVLPGSGEVTNLAQWPG
eukprot:2839814-Rhodomonas_salina.5